MIARVDPRGAVSRGTSRCASFVPLKPGRWVRTRLLLLGFMNDSSCRDVVPKSFSFQCVTLMLLSHLLSLPLACCHISSFLYSNSNVVVTRSPTCCHIQVIIYSCTYVSVFMHPLLPIYILTTQGPTPRSVVTSPLRSCTVFQAVTCSICMTSCFPIPNSNTLLHTYYYYNNPDIQIPFPLQL